MTSFGTYGQFARTLTVPAPENALSGIDAGCDHGMRPRNNSLDLPFVLSAKPTRRTVQEESMNGLIYLIGLIVVIMAILSFLGLR